MLACKDVGSGKMPEPDVLVDAVLKEIAHEKDMKGLQLLVTAGPTREALDPVRFLTNHSTGKMGYAIAKAAMRRGAKVTLVTGKTGTPKPRFVHTVEVESAEEMFRAVKERFEGQDIIIKAAAVADYRPAAVSDQKIKKLDGEKSLPLLRTTDILSWLGEHKKEGQFLCGFAMETERLLENARGKLKRKHLDMIAANSLRVAGAGFGTDTNVVTLLTQSGEMELPTLTKDEVANRLLDEILNCRGAD